MPKMIDALFYLAIVAGIVAVMLGAAQSCAMLRRLFP